MKIKQKIRGLFEIKKKIYEIMRFERFCMWINNDWFSESWSSPLLQYLARRGTQV